MQTLLTMVGLPMPAFPSLILMLTIVVLACLLFGWIADLLLGPAAFGTLVNTVIVLVGGFLGAWLWHRYGVPTRFDATAVQAGVAVGSGLMLVLVLAMVMP